MVAQRARRRPAAPDRANNPDPGPPARHAGRAMLTPPQLAERWGVSPEKVVAFIRRGELRAVNVALRLGGRPRWRIDPADVERFEAARAAVPTPRSPRRRKDR